MKKLALSATETAITIGVVAVIAILCIGMFTDSLHGIVANSGVSNVFTNNAEVQQEKTGYSSYNRNYAASQIEVQITGEQGLEMLRKKVNNKALDLINSDFTKNAIEIAYLARVAEIISGEPYLCVYMDKNSDNHCPEFSKYQYKTTVSTALSIPEKTNAALALTNSAGKNAGSVLAAVQVPKDNNGYPYYSANKQENIKAKYKAIQDLTTNIESYVTDKSVLVMPNIKRANANIDGRSNSGAPSVNSLKNNVVQQMSFESAFSKVLQKLRDAHDECKCSLVEDVPKTNIASTKSKCGDYGLLKSKEEMRADHRYVNNGSIEQFEAAVKNINSIEDLQELLKDPNSSLLEPVRRDNYFSSDDNACAVFNNALKSLGVDPVVCTPYGSYDKW